MRCAVRLWKRVTNEPTIHTILYIDSRTRFVLRRTKVINDLPISSLALGWRSRDMDMEMDMHDIFNPSQEFQDS